MRKFTMKNTWFNHSACLIAGCSALALSVGANAQSASSDFVLEEIVVTAQKREQSLQDVPISISALSGDKINTFAAGGEDIRLLSSRVPGLNAESSNGRVAPRFYIRGLGNTDFDLAASQPVSVVVDEVVQENVILKSFPLFDVERVEVLRGPQGTLFGRNTPAGIISSTHASQPRKLKATCLQATARTAQARLNSHRVAASATNCLPAYPCFTAAVMTISTMLTLAKTMPLAALKNSPAVHRSCLSQLTPSALWGISISVA